MLSFNYLKKKTSSTQHHSKILPKSAEKHLNENKDIIQLKPHCLYWPMNNQNKDLPPSFFCHSSWCIEGIFSKEKSCKHLSYYGPTHFICSTNGKKEWSQSRYVYMQQSHPGTLSRSMCKQGPKALWRWSWFLTKGHFQQLLPTK